MEGSMLTKVVLPVALFVVMLGMGLSLAVTDFKRVGTNPKGILVGLSCQMLMLPALGIVTAVSLGMSPLLSAGLLILCLCPGGVTSNLFCYLAKGNVALSITLTAVVSLITPFSIPVLADWGMAYFLGEGRTIQLPLMRTIITLIAITVLPVGLGMLIKQKRGPLAKRAETPVKVLSMVLLFVIIAGIVRQNWDKLPDFFAQTGIAVVLLNIGTMVIGYFVGRIVALDRKDSIAIGVEVGIQNGTTALFITSTLLADPILSIPAATYSLVMFVTGAAYSYIFQRQSASST
ncbi:bile acid:sodium symporter family protein [Pseudobacteriovorax antillogorgiicola]|uniref:Bile acid:Na+ symporter, BASS family n=1 Tax=Pseudobacteriovorax antillogorgiicola TaxID=1513793 RepID=A0A1Y6B6L9_9BACT|nr:bile acid:sodium symporter family protein [Pseudobacteriovorax antillogorgiicola]TCS58779.1 BASS family bile acid:Na+ symporter [Pseudobacteriovorax antillogorgiicola]SME94806.1 bile acid:Na+ symporter, BASS family [Pseudobacteriovorax antillogorgiicola]